jgi:hypothetical protein
MEAADLFGNDTSVQPPALRNDQDLVSEAMVTAMDA